MHERQYPQPLWWLLYLSLPLAALLFWLIARATLAAGVRRGLEIGAILIVFGYVEIWHMANRVALLYHPLGVRPGQPLYKVQEAPPPGHRLPAIAAEQPALTYTFYSDLFMGPVSVTPGADSLPALEAPARQRP